MGVYDTRLNLKGRNGGSLVLELSSEVLAANSAVFADLIADYRKTVSGLCRVEVPDVDNLNVFRETVELMFEEDIQKKLVKIGVFRVIDILEVFFLRFCTVIPVELPKHGSWYFLFLMLCVCSIIWRGSYSNWIVSMSDLCLSFKLFVGD